MYYCDIYQYHVHMHYIIHISGGGLYLYSYWCMYMVYNMQVCWSWSWSWWLLLLDCFIRVYQYTKLVRPAAVLYTHLTNWLLCSYSYIDIVTYSNAMGHNIAHDMAILSLPKPEPNMLKVLPIIPSSASQKLYPLFFLFSYHHLVLPFYSFWGPNYVKILHKWPHILNAL